MASKLLQINHINLNFCYSNIGHNKFSLRQITERESQIIDSLDWEVTTETTPYQVYELITMMIKRRLHEKITLKETEGFMKEVFEMALQILRLCQCSLESINMQADHMAAAAIQLSLAYILSIRVAKTHQQ